MCLCVRQQRAKGVLIAGCFFGAGTKMVFFLKFTVMGKERKGRCSERVRVEGCRRPLE